MTDVRAPFVAAGAAVVEDGRVLMVRQVYPPFAGQWVLPAGLAEAGETLEATIRRELLEEARIPVEVVGLIGLTSVVAPPPAHVFALFLCRSLGGEPVPDGVENDAARFLSLQEIEALGEAAEAQSRLMARRVLGGDYRLLPPADLQSGSIFTAISSWM